MMQTTPAQIHSRLKVFVIAAQRLSFTETGEALSITTAAISQQIKALEDWLGFRLFRRLQRKIELTEEGQRLFHAVQPAYSKVDETIRRLRGGPLSGVVQVRALPSFLSFWLLPRLRGLMRQYPFIELRLEAEDSARSLREGEFDLAVDLNDGLYPGFQSSLLMEEQIFPVLAPALLRDRPTLCTPQDLEHYPLLHDITAWRGSEPYAEWTYYLKAIGAPDLDVRRGYMFNRHQLTIKAAIEGMGVAIARRMLTTTELGSGQLLEPFPQRVSVGKRYCLVYASGALDDHRVAAVHDWIVAEAAIAVAQLSKNSERVG